MPYIQESEYSNLMKLAKDRDELLKACKSMLKLWNDEIQFQTQSHDVGDGFIDEYNVWDEDPEEIDLIRMAIQSAEAK